MQTPGRALEAAHWRRGAALLVACLCAGWCTTCDAYKPVLARYGIELQTHTSGGSLTLASERKAERTSERAEARERAPETTIAPMVATPGDPDRGVASDPKNGALIAGTIRGAPASIRGRTSGGCGGSGSGCPDSGSRSISSICSVSCRSSILKRSAFWPVTMPRSTSNAN